MGMRNVNPVLFKNELLWGSINKKLAWIDKSVEKSVKVINKTQRVFFFEGKTQRVGSINSILYKTIKPLKIWYINK